MRLSIIVALARNRAIGRDNGLIYHLPADLKHFKQLTTGHTIVMGRRTFESLPKGALPGRRNVVLSRSGQPQDFPGADLFRSLADALADCAHRAAAGDAEAEDVYVIGGASVYAAALPLAQRLCLTYVDDTPSAADTFFPDFSLDEWRETGRGHHDADERHAVAFDFVDLERCLPASHAENEQSI